MEADRVAPVGGPKPTAGFSARQAVTPRLLVLAAATALVVVVSAAVTALSFQPQQWVPFVLGVLLAGLIYGMLGALVGALVGVIGATYLMLFAAMLDLGIVQNPMFGSGSPPGWGSLLPGYGPGRVLVDAAFSSGFHAWGALALSLAWAVLLAAAVVTVLGRLVGIAPRAQQPRPPAVA